MPDLLRPGPPAPFIIGAPRSGTTLLRLMLDSHPTMAIPPETHFLHTLAGLEGTGDEVRRAFHATVTGADSWNRLHLSEHGLEDALSTVEPFEASAGVRALFALYAETRGKPRWGDKTPVSYCRHLPTVQALLPEARFIHVLRDGRDVAMSVHDAEPWLAQLWFPGGTDTRAVARQWASLALDTRASGAACHYMEVRFEDLVREPRGTLERVCAFVELDFHPAMERYHQNAGKRMVEDLRGGPMTYKKTHGLVEEPPRPERAGRWRQEMSAQDVRAFEDEVNGELAELGYRPSRRWRRLLRR